MPATADELRRVALELFASSGYHATSLQHIAEVAGVSKASVLYHFASKELLLEAALSPAIDRLGEILDGASGLADSISSTAQTVSDLHAERRSSKVFEAGVTDRLIGGETSPHDDLSIQQGHVGAATRGLNEPWATLAP